MPLVAPSCEAATSAPLLGVLQCCTTTTSSSSQQCFSDADMLAVHVLAGQACTAVGKACRFDAEYRYKVQACLLNPCCHHWNFQTCRLRGRFAPAVQSVWWRRHACCWQRAALRDLHPCLEQCVGVQLRAVLGACKALQRERDPARLRQAAVKQAKAAFGAQHARLLFVQTDGSLAARMPLVRTGIALCHCQCLLQRHTVCSARRHRLLKALQWHSSDRCGVEPSECVAAQAITLCLAGCGA